jgi:hypothetical protein
MKGCLRYRHSFHFELSISCAPFKSKLFFFPYLRNTDASTFLVTRATGCVRYRLVACIKRAFHTNCLICLLHNDRVLLNYHMVHIPSPALCKAKTLSWLLKSYAPYHVHNHSNTIIRHFFLLRHYSPYLSLSSPVLTFLNHTQLDMW